MESTTPEGAPVPEKGVADLLQEAFGLYRAHAKPLLLICAVLFVPAAIANALALAAILGPTIAPQGVGEFTLFCLQSLATVVTTLFLYGIVIPLTNGALTIAAADRILGGHAEWSEVWMLLFRRLGKLLSAVVPAALVVTLGFLLFFFPGLVLAVLFAFVSPIVLIEGIGGRAALERSTKLVVTDWLRVALMLAGIAVVRWAARIVTGAVIPHGSIFLSSLLADLATMIVLPIPVLGVVLLYLDVRRKRDGFTNEDLRADLEALRREI